jgi:hypothetical protein
MKLIPIEVRTYSATKSEELPKSFVLGNDALDILEITDRWYQGDNNADYPVSDYYKVRASDSVEYLLKHEMKNDRWFICNKE